MLDLEAVGCTFKHQQFLLAQFAFELQLVPASLDCRVVRGVDPVVCDGEPIGRRFTFAAQVPVIELGHCLNGS